MNHQPDAGPRLHPDETKFRCYIETGPGGGYYAPGATREKAIESAAMRVVRGGQWPDGMRYRVVGDEGLVDDGTFEIDELTKPQWEDIVAHAQLAIEDLREFFSEGRRTEPVVWIRNLASALDALDDAIHFSVKPIS